MFCNNCGAEIGDAKFCPHCGARQVAAQVVDAAAYSSTQSAPKDSTAAFSVEEKYRGVFKDPLFLVICILMSVSMVLSVFSYNSATGMVTVSLSIFSILYVIGLWITFGTARGDGSFNGTGLAICSGTVKATYIISWIGIVFLVLFIAGLAIAGPSLLYIIPELFHININTGGFVPSSYSISGPSGDLDINIEGLPFDIREFMTGPGIQTLVIGAAVVVAIIVIVAIIVNICFVRNLHKFTKSVCVSLETGNYDIKKADTSRKWMIAIFVLHVLGIAGTTFSIGNTVGSLSVISSICSAAAVLISSLTIKKHFVD